MLIRTVFQKKRDQDLELQKVGWGWGGEVVELIIEQISPHFDII
jgi:hypothetical protein